MAETLDFYFDFISPFSYLAFQRVPAIAKRHGLTLNCQVVNLAEAKLLAGNTGPTTREQPLKRRYSQFDKDRWAARYGVPIVNPKGYGPDRLNRGTFFAADRGQTLDYIARAWRRVWGEGGAMDDDELIAGVAREMGWREGEFLDFTRSPGAEERYKASTRDAHERGVFGVPTIFVGAEMWWGNDRLDFLEEYLAKR